MDTFQKLLLLLLNAMATPGHGRTTCGNVRDVYRDSSCCGNPGVELGNRAIDALAGSEAVRTLEFNVGIRKALVLAPTAPPTRPRPVFIWFHGYMGTPLSWVGRGSYVGFGEYVASLDYVLVLPYGLQGEKGASNVVVGQSHWDATAECCNFVKDRLDAADSCHATQTCDVDFVATLFDNIVTFFGEVGPLVVGGHSNGAFMANRLLFNSSLPVAGILGFAGYTWNTVNASMVPRKNVKVLYVHAPNDGTTTYDGMPKLSGFALGLGEYTAEMMEKYMRMNGCTTPTFSDMDVSESLDLLQGTVEEYEGAETLVHKAEGCAAQTIHWAPNVPYDVYTTNPYVTGSRGDIGHTPADLPQGKNTTNVRWSAFAGAALAYILDLDTVTVPRTVAHGPPSSIGLHVQVPSYVP